MVQERVMVAAFNNRNMVVPQPLICTDATATTTLAQTTNNAVTGQANTVTKAVLVPLHSGSNGSHKPTNMDFMTSLILDPLVARPDRRENILK